MESLWSSRAQFFPRITVAESNGCYVFATYGLCVWGQPLFRRAFLSGSILVSVSNFLHLFNFRFSFQFPSRGGVRGTNFSKNTSFSRSPLLKATIYFCDIRPLCVGATPVPKGFYHMSNFITCPILVSVPNLQAGAHGILDPPCATKLRSWMGYQG